MNKIKQSTVLQGETVILVPLTRDHFTALQKIAEEKRIWEFYPVDMLSPEKCLNAFNKALFERGKGSQFPFAIFHKEENRLIGSTRLMNIEPAHRKLEIGWTWLHPRYWATEVNLECKLLLLSFCFEQWQAIRVQFRTDEKNIRSRRAIEKIGGAFEGILRNDWIKEDGGFRNTAYFSIIHTEWEIKKTRLKTLYETKKNSKTKIHE
jgi:RimJ/RimL family protein N-acetyltransferase